MYLYKRSLPHPPSVSKPTKKEATFVLAEQVRHSASVCLNASNVRLKTRTATARTAEKFNKSSANTKTAVTKALWMMRTKTTSTYSHRNKRPGVRLGRRASRRQPRRMSVSEIVIARDQRYPHACVELESLRIIGILHRQKICVDSLAQQSFNVTTQFLFGEPHDSPSSRLERCRGHSSEVHSPRWRAFPLRNISAQARGDNVSMSVLQVVVRFRSTHSLVGVCQD
jgi:hypothetical protein